MSYICLNYSDILINLYNKFSCIESVVSQTKKFSYCSTISRIYIGSYFCGNYFLNIPNKIISEFSNYCQSNNISITLVLPIFSETDLSLAKTKINDYIHIFNNKLDEITVNDFGMLTYISNNTNLNVNIGRIFQNNVRDPRYPDFYEQNTFINLNKFMRNLESSYSINNFEFDLTHSQLTINNINNTKIALHTPYCYITTGQICEFSSISKEICYKFRPSDSCICECSQAVIGYTLHSGVKLLRIGKAIFFENSHYIINGSFDREIYTPIGLREVKW